jgi:hypothetical protein
LKDELGEEKEGLAFSCGTEIDRAGRSLSINIRSVAFQNMSDSYSKALKVYYFAANDLPHAAYS